MQCLRKKNLSDKILFLKTDLNLKPETDYKSNIFYGNFEFGTIDHVQRTLFDRDYLIEIYPPKKTDTRIIKQNLWTSTTIIIKNVHKTWSKSTLQFLEKNGVCLHDYKEKIFDTAIRRGDVDIIEFMTEHKLDDGICYDDILKSAAKNGHYGLVKFALKSGATANTGQNYAINWASRNGHYRIVKILHKNGADIKNNKCCPLRWSAECGHYRIVKYLVKNGANPKAKDLYAVKWALYHGHEKIIYYLFEKCPKHRDYILKLAEINIKDFASIQHPDLEKYVRIYNHLQTDETQQIKI